MSGCVCRSTAHTQYYWVTVWLAVAKVPQTGQVDITYYVRVTRLLMPLQMQAGP